VNNESFPVLAYACPVNSDPGVNVVNPIQFLSQPQSRRVMLGSSTSGACRGSVQIAARVSDFGGSSNTSNQDAYTGTVSGSAPPNNVYVMFGIVTFGGTVLSAGVCCDATLAVDLDFMELATPPT